MVRTNYCIISKHASKLNNFLYWQVAHQIDHSDTDLLKKIIEVLEPFKVVTLIVSEEQPMASLVLPLLWRLLNAVNPAETDTPKLREFKKAIRDDLNSR